MLVITAILILFTVILVHEIGHAFTAWVLGVPFEQFSIGIPWPKRTTFRWGKFTFSPWILLAFVKFNEEETDKAPFWKKIAITLAGPLANALAAAIVSFAVYGVSVGTWANQSAYQVGVDSTYMLLSGQIPVTALSGPIGIIIAVHSMISQIPSGWIPFIWVVVSYSIAVINLVPIPALDGGQLLTFIICLISGTDKMKLASQNITKVFGYLIYAFIIILALKDIVVSIIAQSLF